MQTHYTLGKAGRDGVLHLEIPVGAPDAEFEVVVVLEPSLRASPPAAPEHPGWSPRFFEGTAGSIQDPTFRRHDQGEFERHSEF